MGGSIAESTTLHDSVVHNSDRRPVLMVKCWPVLAYCSTLLAEIERALILLASSVVNADWSSGSWPTLQDTQQICVISYGHHSWLVYLSSDTVVRQRCPLQTLCIIEKLATPSLNYALSSHVFSTRPEHCTPSPSTPK